MAKTVADYLNDIVTCKKKLAESITLKQNAASYTNSLESLIESVDNFNTTTFYTNSNIVKIRLIGSGEVSIACVGFEEKTISLVEDEYSEICFEHNDIQSRKYRITNIKNIVELDLSDNGITEAVFNEDNNIVKLILNNNNLTQLNCNHFNNIQFLHMFNNPICDDENSMKCCVDSLPNRTGKAMGSIIFYPWYGLETLIEEIDGKYYKYPYLPEEIGNVNHSDNPNRKALSLNGREFKPSIYDENNNYRFEANKLYGVVQDGVMTYYTRSEDNTQLNIHTQMNQHHLLRKNLERSSISKNWVFGSAILYDEDEKKRCGWDFIRNNIADMWETAEKGFGLTIGSFDVFAGHIDRFEELNLVGFFDVFGNATAPVNEEDVEIDLGTETNSARRNRRMRYDRYNRAIAEGKSNNSIHHGDATASKFCGRGGNSVYGYAPNASVVLVDALENIISNGVESIDISNKDWRDRLEKTTAYSDLMSMAFIPNSSEDYNVKLGRKIISEFGNNKGVFCLSAGNNGDGDDFTAEILDRVSYGDYIDGAEKLKSGVVIINNYFGNSLNNGTSETIVRDNGTPSVSLGRYDKIGAFGSSVVTWTDYVGEVRGVNGTSMAAPVAAGILCLMQNIYKKMNPGATEFGKATQYYNFIIENWTQRFESQNDTNDGIGSLNMFKFTKDYEQLDSGVVPTILSPINGYEIGKCIKLGYEINNEGQYKKAYTIDDMENGIYGSHGSLNRYFTMTRDGYVCFHAMPPDDSYTLKLMSNSSFYNSDSTIKIIDVPVTVKENSTNLSVLETTVIENTNKEYTVQILMNIPKSHITAQANAFRYWFKYIEPTSSSEILLGYNKGGMFGVKTSPRSKYLSASNIVAADLSYFSVMPAEDANKYIVVTMTCGKKDVELFFNGKFMAAFARCEEDDILNFDKLHCYNDSNEELDKTVENKVYTYNRVLTDKEIAENAAAILASNIT